MTNTPSSPEATLSGLLPGSTLALHFQGIKWKTFAQLLASQPVDGPERAMFIRRCYVALLWQHPALRSALIATRPSRISIAPEQQPAIRSALGDIDLGLLLTDLREEMERIEASRPVDPLGLGVRPITSAPLSADAPIIWEGNGPIWSEADEQTSWPLLITVEVRTPEATGSEREVRYEDWGPAFLEAVLADGSSLARLGARLAEVDAEVFAPYSQADGAAEAGRFSFAGPTLPPDNTWLDLSADVAETLDRIMPCLATVIVICVTPPPQDAPLLLKRVETCFVFECGPGSAQSPTRPADVA